MLGKDAGADERGAEGTEGGEAASVGRGAGLGVSHRTCTRDDELK